MQVKIVETVLGVIKLIVQEHGGTLSVDTDLILGGARFTLWLPAEGVKEAAMPQEPVLSAL